MANPHTIAQTPSFIAILFVFLSLTILTCAQTPITSATTATAAIVPSASSYTYIGCYNETSNTNRTGGLRALNGGVNEALDAMTVPLCTAFCKSNGYAYAGIEYTRECYCAQYLSALAPRVHDSHCDLPCMGNASQVCGGSWTLSVYLQGAGKEGAAGGGRGEQLGGKLMVMVVVLGLGLGWVVGGLGVGW